MSTVGKRIIIGLTFFDAKGALTEQVQVHGRLRSISDSEGIAVTRPNGGTYTIPPDVRNLKPARPGGYSLRSNLQFVLDPDYLASWTMRDTRAEAVQVQKSFGFAGPY